MLLSVRFGLHADQGLGREWQQMCRRTKTLGQGCGCSAETHLTVREIQVLLLVASGLSNCAIGRDLGISPRTVEEHLAMMRKRAGAHDRAELVARCFAAEILLPTWPPSWSGRNCTLIIVSPYIPRAPPTELSPCCVSKTTSVH